MSQPQIRRDLIGQGYEAEDWDDAEANRQKRKRDETQSDITSPSKKQKVNMSDTSKPSLRSSNNAPGKVKKLTIKNLKSSTGLPSDYMQSTWSTLETAVHAIQNHQPVSTQLEELYSSVETLVTHKLAEQLYSKLEAKCASHYQSVNSTIEQHIALDSDRFLNTLNQQWEEHCQQMVLIRNLFSHLDRKYTLTTPNVKSIWDLGLSLFRVHIADIEDIRKKTIDGLVDLLKQERNGETVDRTLVHNLIRMYISLGMYEPFETALLQATRAYYSKEAAHLFSELDYLEKMDQRFKEEEYRLNYYLKPITKKPLFAILEEVMILDLVDGLINKGFVGLVDASKTTDLALLYSYLLRVSALKPLKEAWKAHITRKGMDLISDNSKVDTLIDDLLALRAKLYHILEAGFQLSEEFSSALKDSFEAFINSKQDAPAELLAKYVNSKLRAGNKKVSNDVELDTMLDNALTIFRYLNGKDTFEAFYKKDLAKRLLLGKSISIDAEKTMIAKLKAECGVSFTSKMEGMFKDVDSSKDITAEFLAYLENKHFQTSISSSIHVLATGFWPSSQPVELQLPRELATLQEKFHEYYTSKFHGRRLVWLHTHGHCKIKASFPKGKKEISVSLFQSVVMLLLNDASKVTFQEVRDQTKLGEDEAKRTLTSLCNGKFKIFNKEPANDEFAPTDSFSLNTAFAAKLYRIKINQVQLKETKVEQAKTHESVHQDRVYQMDAAVVRIMKARKSLDHTELITELLKQLRFPCKVTDLKKRIESLIERDYLVRDENNADLYNYVA